MNTVKPDEMEWHATRRDEELRQVIFDTSAWTLLVPDTTKIFINLTKIDHTIFYHLPYSFVDH